MESVKYFSSTLSGPATHENPLRVPEDPEEADDAEQEPEHILYEEENDNDECGRAPDELAS